jgi:hypothetical protein
MTLFAFKLIQDQADSYVCFCHMDVYSVITRFYLEGIYTNLFSAAIHAIFDNELNFAKKVDVFML